MLDLLIVGGGPAGLTAGLYAVRAGLDTLLLERKFSGGQASTANLIENYPGFDSGVGGPELAMAMEKQAVKAGLNIRYDTCSNLSLTGDIKRATLTADHGVEARAVILAMGAQPRKTGARGEEELRGHGVSWCATCDGFMMRGKRAVVIGGGNTAAEDALYLSNLCEHVTIIHRRDAMRADHALVRKILDHKKITVLWDHVVTSFIGEKKLRAVEVAHTKTGERSELDAEGAFIAVGGHPDTAIAAGQVATDLSGYIIAGEDTRTNLPLVYAAGDLRAKPLRQIVTASADGAIAATMAMQDLRFGESERNTADYMTVDNHR
ncbi:MAG: FAD-dependent oxidoreductase [Oscillospiraceae bacterium]|jgi:thioredoxin reductase (NADPH)|nr:FAD-dependent oxidoreductase [Oscillospiraceae bacterium]